MKDAEAARPGARRRLQGAGAQARRETKSVKRADKPDSVHAVARM